MFSWLRSLLPFGAGPDAQPRGGKRSLCQLDDNFLRNAKRARRTVQQAKRLRMIGLHGEDDCTERDFWPDRLPSTAERMFGKGLLAREKGDQAKAFH